MVSFVFPESYSEIMIHNDLSSPNPSFSFFVKNIEEFYDEC